MAAGRRVAFRSNSVQGQLAAAVAGFGIAFLPCLLADGVPGLERRPLPGPPLTREAWLLVHRDRRGRAAGAGGDRASGGRLQRRARPLEGC